MRYVVDYLSTRNMTHIAKLMSERPKLTCDNIQTLQGLEVNAGNHPTDLGTLEFVPLFMLKTTTNEQWRERWKNLATQRPIRKIRTSSSQ